ncbi:patatin family protein [Shewanella sp. A25]|nr:patatin family protein [Shewanella shenzhenensis]
MPPVVSNTPSLHAEKPAKVALVAEGGGQRGIFTAGVLDAWLEAQFDPFDMFIGTSAGSQNLTSFLARQKGYAKKLIRGLTRHKRFYQLGRGLVGANIVDLDWYFEQTRRGSFKLDLAAASQSLGQRELFITTTNARDRKAYFFSPQGRQHWRELLKASSALPFLYKQGVKLTTWFEREAANSSDIPVKEAMEQIYLDGGLAAPLPVMEAYRRGARKIVVIRTVNDGFALQSVWVHKLKTWICGSSFCPRTIDYLVQHERAYQAELDFMANPPADVEIVQVFAKDSLQSKLLGSSDANLRFDYQQGLKAGRQFLVKSPLAHTQLAQAV